MRKTEPAPLLPEEKPWERFERAFRTVLTVSKKALLKEEVKLKRTQARKKQTKKPL